ncbi:MAG: hypothetical protein RL199_2528 [Pseudomonadota bacterium]|jgi:hypothetical protein
MRRAVGLLLIAAAACRASLDEGVIVCRDGGDASCPTGWHCDPDDRCRPGEVAPEVRWLDPSADAAVTGRTSVHFEARSLRGLAAATVRVVSPLGLVTTLAAEPVVTHDDGTRMTFAAPWTTWTSDDGPIDLEAVVTPGAPPLAPGRATLRVRVANDVPRLAISSPADGALVDGAFAVAASFTSNLPVTGVEVGLQQAQTSAASAPLELAFSDEDHLTGSFATTLDATELANGPATVSLRVTDLRGRTSTTGIPVLVEHAR